jgi:NAD(P)-dependent dehydrogenase (short-subunit alcohol dehydrogenase family)
MQDLTGKIAVVTGASKGLGRCLAQALAEAGCQVALVARPSRALEAVEAEIGARVRAFPCDLRHPDQIQSVFAAILETYGRIDILINNAALVLLNPIDTVPDADILGEVETNFLAPIRCVRAVVPAMKLQGSGDIINITSEAVHMPMPFLTIYAATKGGLEIFSRGLRSELQGDGIRVMIFRAGSMGEVSSAELWNPDIKTAFYDRLRNTGLGHYSGEAFPPAVPAGAIVDLLRLDRRATVDHIELRSSK